MTLERVLFLLFLVLVAGLAVAIWWIRDRKKRGKIRATHGLSEFQEMAGPEVVARRNAQLDRSRPWTLWGRLVDAENGEITNVGVVTDDHSAIDVYGGPGSGKTAGTLIPAVLRHPGAALVSTTKSDLAKSTIRARAQVGPVHVFDPGADAVHTPSLAPYQAVWTPITEGASWRRAELCARGLLGGLDSASDQKNSFFHFQAGNLLAILLILLHATPGSTMEGFTERLKALNPSRKPDETEDAGEAVSQAWDALEKELETEKKKAEVAADAGDTDGWERYQTYVQALAAYPATRDAARAAETRAGIMGSLGQVAAAWVSSYATYAQPWDKDNTLDPQALADDDTATLYLICPDAAVRPLTNALLGAYVEALARRAMREGGSLPAQRLIVLDELVHCTPHSDLCSWMANLARSARIKFIISSQCFADLQDAYGDHKARSIHNACSGGHLLLGGGSDLETFKLFTEQAGKRQLWIKTTQAVTTGSNSNTESGHIFAGSTGESGSTTVTEGWVERDVANAARLSAMPVFHGLAILKGTSGSTGLPVQIQLLPWFQDDDLRAAARGDADALRAIRQPPLPPRRR